MILTRVSIFLFLASAVIGFSGCANVNQQGQSQEVTVKSQSQEVNAFFVAGKEAQYLALQCNSRRLRGSIRLFSADGGQISSHLPGRCPEETAIQAL